ncbi:MAG: hypothetical protein A2365_00870 [Candidatus Nealsonbacteria bacterium RIFOXYB1_FULL_40_15]|uniref:Uncharacterized protein n=2 Tax=Candidatus Nealsoniibacteriota TaxID=1817911 RepID=A0A1G2EQK9_9BACT|nr:MAG: hypothetical protein A2365_00870 [Candidatus Nealsonbacteria bacterium RIFOXYB1_FULL_40_15]OGZ28074.1 MAG: hypothetical protein A2427_03350 [Candidatus Nealsonbacteria bacterium RIFOXYC1_FULL_40_7]OGZ28535.1 MAG: hypothetical protein A2562_03560 [Candidatus Nealsonbacteria bacterium RIFOXYD1_FULL_39_11]
MTKSDMDYVVAIAEILWHCPCVCEGNIVAIDVSPHLEYGEVAYAVEYLRGLGVESSNGDGCNIRIVCSEKTGVQQLLDTLRLRFEKEILKIDFFGPLI